MVGFFFSIILFLEDFKRLPELGVRIPLAFRQLHQW